MAEKRKRQKLKPVTLSPSDKENLEKASKAAKDVASKARARREAEEASLAKIKTRF